VYIRVCKAERLLLETDDHLTTISGQCGFSDIKYFNRTFQKWFLVKPADYRKIYQQQIGKDSRIAKVDEDKVRESIRHLKNLTEQHTGYKVSMTPITH
jgi:hypothetical protein